MKKGKFIKCYQCKKENYYFPRSLKKNKKIGYFCNHKCKSLFTKGIRFSIKTEFKKGIIPWNKGIKIIREKHSGDFKKGFIPWNKGLKGFRMGEKNNMWKGGITKDINHIRELSRNYSRKKRLDPKKRLDCNIASAICMALRGDKKRREWQKLVNYTLEDLIRYLEEKFNKKMNWENYGKYWHIDHIKPKSLFKFETAEDEEFKKCWALENLQPLEKILNLKKGNKF